MVSYFGPYNDGVMIPYTVCFYFNYFFKLFNYCITYSLKKAFLWEFTTRKTAFENCVLYNIHFDGIFLHMAVA